MTMFHRFSLNEQTTSMSCVRSESGFVSACAGFARVLAASVCASAESARIIIMDAAILAASIIFIIIRAIICAIIKMHPLGPNVWTSVQTA